MTCRWKIVPLGDQCPTGKRANLKQGGTAVYVVAIGVLVLAIMVVSPIVRSWLSNFSYKAKTGLLLFLLLISLLANAGVAGHYVVFECILGGGGQFEASPDGQFVAHAESLRPYLTKAEPAHYVLKIESAEGRVVKSVRIDAGETKDAEYFRSLPKIIHWSLDSREVVFDIPGIQVRMDRETHAATP